MSTKQLNVFVPQLNQQFSSASQCAKTLLSNLSSDSAAARHTSISGRVSRAYHSGGATVLGFTVIPMVGRGFKAVVESEEGEK